MAATRGWLYPYVQGRVWRCDCSVILISRERKWRNREIESLDKEREEEKEWTLVIHTEQWRFNTYAGTTGTSPETTSVPPPWSSTSKPLFNSYVSLSTLSLSLYRSIAPSWARQVVDSYAFPLRNWFSNFSLLVWICVSLEIRRIRLISTRFRFASYILVDFCWFNEIGGF